MRRDRILLIALLLFGASLASADSIVYDVTVDTSSISGDMGSLDFQFNPGPLVSQAASLQILDFTSDGTLVGGPYPTGDVSGVLPGALTFDNGGFFNDYFQDFSYGSTISFQVSVFGPALSSPDGVSTSGSTFAFSMFTDPEGETPALTTDTTDGFATLINVNLDGTTSVTNYSPAVTIVPETSAVPEPSSLLLLLVAFSGLVWMRSRRANHQLP